MKNIAICFFGNTGGHTGGNGKGGYMDPRIPLENLKDKIKNSNINFYYFIHSWSVEYKDTINDVFSFSDQIFERNSNLKVYTFDEMGLKHFDSYKSFLTETQWKKFEDLLFGIQSRWYSNCKSLELMKSFSENKSIKFDLVFQSRLDMFYKTKLNFNDLDPRYFYCNGRSKQRNIALGDFFFVSNYTNAVNFSSIYSDINNYSLRAPVAVKQHLERKNILYKDYLNESEFELYRDFKKIKKLSKKQIMRNFIIKFLKKNNAVI